MVPRVYGHHDLVMGEEGGEGMGEERGCGRWEVGRGGGGYVGSAATV